LPVTLRTRALSCVAAALLVMCCFSSAVRATPYLSAEIESALAARSGFLQNTGLTEEDFISFDSWIEANGLQQFEGRVAGSSGPWPHYMRGLVSNDGNAAAEQYGRAMKAAGPGALWLLSLEFVRYEQYPWADAAFDAVEKVIIGNGGSRAPLLSQKLMLMGNIMAESSPERAVFCYKWANRFDPNHPWWAYKKGGIDFPRSVAGAAPGFISESFNVLLNSWRAQLSFISAVYRYISVTLFMFICALFLVFTIKYLPSGTHHIGDALFRRASPRFRTASSVAIAVSVLILGILPGLWLIAFLTYRFLSPSEKKLMLFACAVLAVSPLDHYAKNFLRHNLEPNSAAALLDRAVNEGYSGGLHEQISANAAKQPQSYANQLALGVSLTKKGDYTAAAEAVDKALKIVPNDYTAMMYAGNIAFLRGDFDGMDHSLRDLIAKYPKCARARYNLAQAYAGEGRLDASDMITDAAKVNAALISDYMRENEHYFDGAPPPLRRVMQPVITPVYFWGRIFPHDWKSAFGNAVRPLWVSAAGALLFIMLAVLGAAVWGKSRTKVRTYFVCRICGRLLCRKCRKGTLCEACNRACLATQNNAATMYNMQKACQDKSLLYKNITKYALGMAVPGAGRLYKGEQTTRRPALVMLISCAVYAAYYCAFTFSTNYPSVTVINPVYFVSMFLIYNITAAIKQSNELSNTLKTRAKMATNA